MARRKRPLKNVCDMHLIKYIPFLEKVRAKGFISKRNFEYWKAEVRRELRLRNLKWR